MRDTKRVLALLATGLILLSATACNKLRARDQLNKGVSSYKNARYEQAIDHFQQAVSFDPSLINARLYLATAYAQQYIPGVDADDNTRMANQAIEQYKSVLERDPKNINSVKGIAYLYLQMKKFDDAKDYYRKAIAMDPNDPEPYYSIGVIDWTQSYQPRMEARAKLGLKPDEELNGKNKDQKAACGELKQQNTPVIEDGINVLKKALDLRPDYDDAMAYMNLMYRERADVECDDPAARAADLKAADEWVDKTMATKKAKAERQPGAQGITMDQGSNK
ncbi:MAG TPA: tetratricopeptide repeat protein [Terriglobales bacterium]|nr:tetratricopeptide repeat protein [Terriglobales bacterium]